jgi:glycolate oxidase FAD binding subunit
VAAAAEGFAEAVDRHLRDFQTLAAGAGMSVEVLRGRDHDALWARLRDFPTDGPPALPTDGLIRLTVPLASVAAALGVVETLPRDVTWVAHAASGAVFVRIPAAGTPEAFARLAEVAQTHRGHAVLMTAPPDVKRGRDVWGPPPSALSLMREIKRQFDPRSLLNPGRFVAFL